MADRFNFTKNLQKIVGTELRKYGFTFESSKYGLKKDDNELYIHFQRSKHNIMGEPFEFYININMYFQYSKGSSFRLNCPTTLKPTEKYIEYMKKYSNDIRYDLHFSEEENDENRKYINSTQWLYSSEEELKEKLFLAKDKLVSEVITEYYEQMIQLFQKYDDRMLARKDELRLIYNINDMSYLLDE
jgi:hypothetical protein